MNRLLIFFIAVAICTGCRPKQPNASPAADLRETDAATAEADVAPPASNNAAELGPPCITDSSCREYLRCESGHCVVPPAMDGRMVEGMPTATFTKDGKVLGTIQLEIADDNFERTRGLMHRDRMHPAFGMLFIFPGDMLRSFWMKNTLIPLDMIHINTAGEVVGVVANAEPLTETPRQTGVPARYVLELVGGRAAELGIEAGAKMRLTGLPPEQSPTP